MGEAESMSRKQAVAFGGPHDGRCEDLDVMLVDGKPPDVWVLPWDKGRATAMYQRTPRRDRAGALVYRYTGMEKANE